MPNPWHQYQRSPSSVFGAVTAAVFVGLYLPVTAIMMASGVRGTFGHNLTVPTAFVACAVLFAIAWGLLTQRRWARALHWMQPFWIEALVFLGQGGIPGRDTLLFDAAAGAVWLAAYWWWLYWDRQSRDWFCVKPIT